MIARSVCDCIDAEACPHGGPMRVKKKRKPRKPKLLAVRLPNITWSGISQSVAWLRTQDLMTPELEEAYALVPQVHPDLDEIRQAALPEKNRKKGWSFYDAWWVPMKGDRTINVPPSQAKNMAGLLRITGLMMVDTQRSNTCLRRAEALEKIDPLDLMAEV